MNEYKIIEIMGDFSTLVGDTILADDNEEAKKLVLLDIEEHIKNYLYAVVEEVK